MSDGCAINTLNHAKAFIFNSGIAVAGKRAHGGRVFMDKPLRELVAKSYADKFKQLLSDPAKVHLRGS